MGYARRYLPICRAFHPPLRIRTKGGWLLFFRNKSVNVRLLSASMCGYRLSAYRVASEGTSSLLSVNHRSCRGAFVHCGGERVERESGACKFFRRVAWLDLYGSSGLCTCKQKLSFQRGRPTIIQINVAGDDSGTQSTKEQGSTKESPICL